MSQFRPSAAPALSTHRRAATAERRRTTAVALGAVVVGVLLAVAIALGTAEPAAGGRTGTGSTDAALAPTGEVNDMGMPVVGTPGAASGSATVAGVEVQGVRWDLGDVPLDVAVRPSWTLRNTTDQPVTLGEPQPEVREGCCPGPITVGERTLAPGATTTVTFELAMHAGMDGPHDLGVHVPVTAGGATDHLTLDVVGDFTG